MISAVVPCFNEEPVLERTARQLARELERLSPGAWEIVVVDDGSTDATAAVAARLARELGIVALSHAENRGKGAALRTGVGRTRGDVVLVCDADGSTPPEALADLLGALRSGADVAIGDRWAPGTALGRPQGPLRRLLGSGYALLARRASGIALRDYNCGFKLFRGELARSLFAACRSDRWTWDVEVLAAAARRGLAIRAVPVPWSQGPRSAVRPLRDAARSLRDLFELWRRLGARPGGEALWPLIAAPAAYVLALCAPALLAGPGAVLGSRSGDLFLQFVHQREFGFGELARGHLPLWNPHIFSGIPALGNIQLALCYPLNALFLLLPLGWAFNASITLHLALGGALMGLWVRSRGAALAPSVAAGILYLGCGANFSHVLAGHQTMICLLPWAPALFWSVDAVAGGGRPGAALAGGGALAMMLLAGYPQFVWHIGVAAALYAGLRLARTDRRLGKAALLACVPLLAAGVAAVQLAATAQAAAGTLREGTLPFGYAAMFALPPENLLTLLAPFPFGGAGGDGYWGRWYLWESQLFFGTTALVAALVALGRRQDRDRWPLFGLAALMLLLALGDATPLFRALYRHLPGFGSFRGHSKWALPATLFLIPLAARGFEAFLSEPRGRGAVRWLPVAAAAGASAAALAVGAAASRDAAPAWWRAFVLALARSGQSYALDPTLAGAQPFLGASLRGAAAALGACAAALVALAAIAAAARRRPALAKAVIGLALLEVFLFDRSYLVSFPIEEARRANVAAAVVADPGDYRVHVQDHPDSAMSTGAFDIWGYDPLVPRRYAEFIAFSQGAPLDTPAVDVPVVRWDPLLALVRLRYVLGPANGGALAAAGPFPHLPRALLVPEFEIAGGGRDAVLARLRRPSFDPARTAILEETPTFPAGAPLPDGSPSRAPARAAAASTDRVIVEADLDAPALLVLTDPYFPGWRARPLPGSPGPTYRILRADYVLQAIPLGAGRHRISVEYAPERLGLWAGVSACTALGMVLAGLALWHRARRAPTP